MRTLPLVRWLGSPDFADPDLRRRARALWIVSWPLLAVVVVLLGVAVVVEPETLERRAVTVASVGVLIVALHAISRRGRPVLASWILVIGLTIIVTQRGWITGGIHTPVAVFYVLFIVMAGVLIGTWGAVATAVVSIGGAIILTIGTANEWLTPKPGGGSPLSGLVFVLLAIGLALVVQWLVAIRMRRDLRQDSLHMLVHDMRTPMQIVLGHLTMLKMDTRDADLEHVEAAIRGAKELSGMTNSILDVGRLEAGLMPVTPAVVDLADLAQSVVTDVRVLYPERDVAVEANGETACRCDYDLTRRILENLVVNALKHTREGSVRVAVARSNRASRIEVRDEGQGIEPERRTRIFERFSAEGVRSVSGQESSGLGLAFCKLAAEAQGGSIRIEDARPSGSVFVVELPRQ